MGRMRTSSFARLRRTARAVLVTGLLLAAVGIVLVLVLDFLPGFAAMAVGVLVALGAGTRHAKIDLLEQSGGHAASVSELGSRSWLPSLGGSSGASLGDNQGLGDGGSEST